MLPEGIPMVRQLSVSAWLKQEPTNQGCIVTSRCFSLCFRLGSITEESLFQLKWNEGTDSPSHVVEAPLGQIESSGWQHLAVLVDGEKMLTTWFLNGQESVVKPLSEEALVKFPGECASEAPELQIGTGDWLPDLYFE